MYNLIWYVFIHIFRKKTPLVSLSVGESAGEPASPATPGAVDLPVEAGQAGTDKVTI